MLFGSLESNFLSSLCILDISPFSDLGLGKVFSQFVGCHFVLLTVSFASQKLCNFMRSHLYILDLSIGYWLSVQEIFPRAYVFKKKTSENGKNSHACELAGLI